MQNKLLQMLTKTTKLNRSQAIVQMVNAATTYCMWPRAGGKTTGGIGPRINHLNNVMPRAQVILYADTYERIYDRLVPNVVDFLTNELNMQDGLDFVMRKKPPESWDKPLIPLNKFDNVITFSSGFSLCCASQKVPGSANAYNAQALIVDEAKYIKEEKINTEVLPAIRGAKKWFGHLPEYRSQWYFTDKWGENIYWIMAKRKLVDQKKVDAVLALQVRISQLVKLMQSSIDPALIKEHARLTALANEIRKTLVFVSEAQPYENIEHVGADYFRDLERKLKPIEYKIAILNKDPDTVEHTFYPALTSEFHYHKIAHDVNPYLPLAIAMDYQWRITPLVAGQLSVLPGRVYTTCNVVCGIDTQHPAGGIEATLYLFTMRFMDHPTKVVYYMFDSTAIGRTPSGSSHRDIAVKYLRDAGWRVVECYMHQPPEHGQKLEAIKVAMENRTEYAIQINEPETVNLRRSISNAATTMSGGKTKKDKSKEKNPAIPVEEGTDFSDAFDQLLWGMLELKLWRHQEEAAIPMSVR